MGRYVGIDLGTTNSVVAVMDGPQPRILENREGQLQTRSIVGLRTRRRKGAETQEILVGEPALANWGLAVHNTVVSIKRLMGRGVADPEVQKVRQWAQYEIREPSDGTEDSVRVVLGGQERSPVDISAMILRKLKEDAEYTLGEDVTHAVITVPAYFSHIQKAATRKAGEEAGLRVIKILDEPTAAAVAYGMDEDEADARTILVFDLGGGTFDISVLVMAGGTFAPLNLEGDMWLGGDTFDQVVVERAVEQVREEFGIDATANDRFMVELRKASQQVKETLSSSTAADLIVPGLLQDQGELIDLVMEVTQEEFESWIANLVNSAVELVEKALRNANLTAEDIDAVLMAGNATRTPMIQRATEEMFGAEKVLRNIHPKHSVAMGAAIVAAVMGGGIECGAPDPDDPDRECGQINEPDADECARCGAPLGPGKGTKAPGVTPSLTLGGIAPFSYGAQTAGDAFTVFVRKGDTYPTESPQTHEFRTRVAGARMISIPIYGGDDLERASANERQGEAFALLPPGRPGGTPVRVSLWLDPDGVFRLSAHLEDGTDLSPWVVEKGEAQDRAIQTLVRVEGLLGELSTIASREDLDQLDAARDRVFESMQGGDFHEALGLAEDLEQAAAKVGVGASPEALRNRAENLAGFAEFVVEQYPWGFDGDRAAEIRALAGKVTTALEEKGEQNLEPLIEELDRATSALPENVVALLAMRAVIAARIHPYDPAAAAQLGRALAEAEEGLKNEDLSVLPQLDAIAAAISQAMEQIPELAGAIRCSRGDLVPPGQRMCPTCGEDTWILTAST